MKTKVAFIYANQFGVHTGMYYYCKYLKDKYDVTYIGIDVNGQNLEFEGVSYYHVKSNMNKFFRRLKFYRLILDVIKKQHINTIFITYFPLCSLLLLFLHKRKVNIDVRTSMIFSSKFRTYVYNLILKIEVKYIFKNRSAISNSLVDYLNLPLDTFILPLGAIDNGNYLLKKWDSLTLLYVGTFYNRRVEETIIGLKEYLINSNYKCLVKYYIIGYGSKEDVRLILDTIKNLNLEDYVVYIGTVRYPELQFYFDKCNVGVSYIPLTPYFNCQPPTKTFEYLLNGMAVIATNTDENRFVIKDNNGFLINDSPISFCKGLMSLCSMRSNFNSNQIINNSREYTWDNIIENIVVPYIERLK